MSEPLTAAWARFQRAYRTVHSAYDGECEHGFGPPATKCPNYGCPDREFAEAWAALAAALASPSLDVERWNAAMDSAMQAVAELQPYGLSPEETPLVLRSDVLRALLGNRLTPEGDTP